MGVEHAETDGDETKTHIHKTEDKIFNLPEEQDALDAMKVLAAKYEEQEKANKPGSNAGLIIVLCIVGALAIAGALWFFVFRSSEEDEELNADDCAVHEEC